MEYYFIVNHTKVVVKYSNEYSDFFKTLSYNVDEKFYAMCYGKTVSLELDVCPQQDKAVTFIKKWDSVMVSTKRPLTDNSVECLIKDVVNELVLLPQSSFVTHGGFGKFGNKIIAFLGESGAGKTTLARKLEKDCYNDERVVIGIKDAKVKVGNYPFGGKERMIFLRPIEEELSAIFFLLKGERLQLKPLSKFEALSQIIRCTTCIDEDGFFGPHDYYKVISHILNRVPAFNLISCLSDSQKDFLNLLEGKGRKWN